MLKACFLEPTGIIHAFVQTNNGGYPTASEVGKVELGSMERVSCGKKEVIVNKERRHSHAHVHTHMQVAMLHFQEYTLTTIGMQLRNSSQLTRYIPQIWSQMYT